MNNNLYMMENIILFKFKNKLNLTLINITYTYLHLAVNYQT